MAYYGADAGNAYIEYWYDKQQRELQRAEEQARRERQRRLDELAKQRTAIARKQKQRMQELQAQQAAALAASQAQAAKLQRQQASRLKQMQKQQQGFIQGQKASQAAALASQAAAKESQMLSMAAGEAVSSSLGILSKAGGQQGRTATVSKPRGRSRGGRRTTSSLSIGQTGSVGGSGINLGM